MAEEPKFDEIGYWSELKLEIIRDYAAAYSKILAAQNNPGSTMFTSMPSQVPVFTCPGPPATSCRAAR